jgi:GT2 family glycosyltransferase
MESARVVVIVLNWNNESDTAACLDSLAVQRDAHFDVLLVDNDSADGSGSRLRQRYPGVAYLQTEANIGYAGGNNRGIAWALEQGAEWIVVLNNDTELATDCMYRLLEQAAGDPRIGALSPLVTRYDDPSRVWFAGGHIDKARAVGVHDGEDLPVARWLETQAEATPARGWYPCTFVCGCCLLLRAEALRTVGAFREDYFAYVEDLELSHRLARAGWALGWVPSARLAHRVPPVGQAPSAFQIRLRDRNRRRFVRDAYSPAWKLVFAAWFWPTRVLLLLKFVLSGDRERSRGLIAGMFDD